MKVEIKQICIDEGSSIRQTMQAINQGGLGLAILVDSATRRFMGLVTDGDVRRALLGGLGLESPVREVSRPQTLTARMGMSTAELERLFSERVRVVPLVDDQERVVDLAIFDRRVYLPVAQPAFSGKELQYVSECVLTGWISSAGKFVGQFEHMMADFVGTRHAVATSSGTTALHLAMLAAGIGPGDEVIVPTLTFIATANAVTYTGAKPVFVDSEEETWNLDPVLVEKAITSRTKAIIPVHLYGHPADMEPLLDLARRHGLAVIEDAAEAHGARWRGRRVGGLGDIGIFSFYGNKIVTTGEGGMLVTNDPDLADRARVLRDHGMRPERRYWHPVLGYNYRLTNLQAAVGVAQMENIGPILETRRKLADGYIRAMAGVRGLIHPPHADWAEPVCWLYSIVVQPDRFGCSRDQLMAALKNADIDSRAFFPCIHRQPIYGNGQSLRVAENLSQNGLSLPSYPGIQPKDIERIAEVIRKAARS